MNDVEKILYEEIREKKITARGIHGRASRTRGYKGKIMFPYDYLSKKEQKGLNGPVITYYLSDINNFNKREEDLVMENNMMSYNEVRNMKGVKERLDLINSYVNQLGGTDKLAEKWGVKKALIHNMTYQLRQKLKKQSKNNDKVMYQDTVKPDMMQVAETAPAIEMVAIERNITHISRYITDKGNGEKVMQLLENLTKVLEYDKEYVFEIVIKDNE